MLSLCTSNVKAQSRVRVSPIYQQLGLGGIYEQEVGLRLQLMVGKVWETVKLKMNVCQLSLRSM